MGQVVQLQYDYGDNECIGTEQVPSLNLNSLFANVEDGPKKRHYLKETRLFFSSS